MSKQDIIVVDLNISPTSLLDDVPMGRFRFNALSKTALPSVNLPSLSQHLATTIAHPEHPGRLHDAS